MFRAAFKDNMPYMTGDELLKKEIATEIILEAVFGRSSDFYLDLYEKGLIDSTFGTETDIEHEYGFTLIGGESKAPEEVYKEIKKVLDKCANDGIDKAAAERAKKVLISRDISLFNNVEAMGNAFIRQLKNNQNPLNYKNAVQSVTYEDIMNRLAEHFDTSNSVLSVVRPI